MRPQLSVAAHGGFKRAVHELTKVDDLDEVLRPSRKQVWRDMDLPSGAFYVRDPFGQLMNLMEHVD